MPDAALRTEVAEAVRAWTDGGFGTFSALDAFGDDVAIDQLAASEGELRLRFMKASTESTFYLFTPGGLAELLNDRDTAANARQVFVGEDFPSFSTVGCRFEPWTTMVPDLPPIEDETKAPIPRRVVRDQVAIVPLSVGPILLTRRPTDASAVFAAWAKEACEQLFLCLCDEVWKDGDDVQITLTGPRKRRLEAALDRIDVKRDLLPVTEVADWIYNKGRDAETRHTLFVYELAREWPADEPFVEVFSDRSKAALEAAETAFRMHVRDANKETLKSLQDLRKTLGDDVSRVVTQTRELTGTLWRDLLVVLAAVLGRFTLLSAPAAGEEKFADGLLYALAIYLFFSIAVTLVSNAKFMTIFRETQQKWRTKLYGFIDPGDFATLATGPLTKAEGVYRWTRNAAIGAYAVAIIALVTLAVATPVASSKKEDAKAGANEAIANEAASEERAALGEPANSEQVNVVAEGRNSSAGNVAVPSGLR